MDMFFVRPFLLVCLLYSSVVFGESMYVWEDEYGKRHFSDQCGAACSAQQVEQPEAERIGTVSAEADSSWVAGQVRQHQRSGVEQKRRIQSSQRERERELKKCRGLKAREDKMLEQMREVQSAASLSKRRQRLSELRDKIWESCR